jgi:hypothetical protein
MAGIAGVLAGGVLETHLNGSMVRFVAAFCVWTVIIFIMILAIRKSARRYYWWYFVPWIPAFVMMAVNTAQCSKRVIFSHNHT